MSQSAILNIRDLHISFASEKSVMPVVRGIDLQVCPGEAFALVGESGSGKSVTALSILQLLSSSARITQGHIWFDGEIIHTKTSQEMQQIRGKKIGMIFQDPMTALNPTMTIGRQISEILCYHKGLTHRQARERATQLLGEVGIPTPKERYHAFPFQLSGGMRQRAMIAMALACQPKLLIADEPTTALDVTIQAQILQLLQKAQREYGMSLLLITHDLGVVAGVCDRAAVMQQGQIVETASVETLFSNPQHAYTQSLLDSRQGGIHATS